MRLVARNLIPFPLRLGLFINSVKDIFYDGFSSLFKGKLSVEVLDMSSILLALIMRDFKTASTTALLLGLGEQPGRVDPQKDHGQFDGISGS